MRALTTHTVLAIGCLTFSHSTLSGELDALLHGTYQFTSSIACAQSIDGFNSESPELPALGSSPGDFAGPSPVITYSTGTIVYDGAGNATHRSTDITVLPGVFVGQSPISAADVNCSLEYNVDSDRSFTQEGTCVVTLLRGGAAGQVIHLPVSKATGQMTPSRDVLIITAVVPEQQLLQFSFGFSTWHICGSSTTAVRMPQGGE
jgi:hypothetical protein